MTQWLIDNVWIAHLINGLTPTILLVIIIVMLARR